MNTFGTLFRVSLWGESHGPSVGVVVDGCPAGLPLAPEDLSEGLDRRRAGATGTTRRREPDTPTFLSGVHAGHTTGTPLVIAFENRDVRRQDYEMTARRPRPGHADFAAGVRYGGHADASGGGHLSGRLTVGLVAAGEVARRLITPIQVHATLTSAGGAEDISSAVQAAVAENDSVGGLVTCVASGVPAGIGEPIFGGLESLFAAAVFAIPGAKGVEFGAGFAAAGMRGSAYNDAIADAAGRTLTNHAGGINGGISNGNEIEIAVAFRPAASIPQPQRTVDLGSGEAVSITPAGRHDACYATRTPVIVEAVTSIVLCDALRMAGRLAPIWTG